MIQLNSDFRALTHRLVESGWKFASSKTLVCYSANLFKLFLLRANNRQHIVNLYTSRALFIVDSTQDRFIFVFVDFPFQSFLDTINKKRWDENPTNTSGLCDGNLKSCLFNFTNVSFDPCLCKCFYVTLKNIWRWLPNQLFIVAFRGKFIKCFNFKHCS